MMKLHQTHKDGQAGVLPAAAKPTERTERAVRDEELRALAEDIVRYCPSLTHLLLALGSRGRSNPLQGLN